MRELPMRNADGTDSGTALASSLKVILRITDRCNQDCAYCYVPREKRLRSRQPLSLEALRHVYAQVLSGRFRHVSFVWHGGEPTSAGARYLDDVICAQAECAAPHVKIENSIQTNTTLVDIELIEVFKKHQLGVGISLDAPPDVHNSLRVFWDGRPSLDVVLEKVELMRRHGLRFGAICVIHARNYHRATEIYGFFKALRMNYQMNPFYQDEGTSASITARLAITPAEYAEALVTTFDRYVDDPEHTIDVSELRDIILSMMVGQSRNCLYTGRCEEFLGVTPGGKVIFDRPEWRIGTVSTLTADAIVDSPQARLIRTRPLALQRNDCAGCEWWGVCRGGCSSRATAIHRDALRSDPFCDTRRLLFAHVRERLTELSQKEVVDGIEEGARGTGCGGCASAG